MVKTVKAVKTMKTARRSNKRIRKTRKSGGSNNIYASEPDRALNTLKSKLGLSTGVGRNTAEVEAFAKSLKSPKTIGSWVYTTKRPFNTDEVYLYVQAKDSKEKRLIYTSGQKYF